MAIDSKIIRIRRGTAADFNVGKTKLVQGEFAVVTDTKEAYFAAENGEAVRLATEKDVSQLQEHINELHSELDENNVGSGSCFDIIINYDGTNNSAELTVGNYNTIMEKFNNKLPVFAMIYSFEERDPRQLFYDYPNYIEGVGDYISVFNSKVDIQFKIFPDDHIEVNYIG